MRPSPGSRFVRSNVTWGFTASLKRQKVVFESALAFRRLGGRVCREGRKLRYVMNPLQCSSGGSPESLSLSHFVNGVLSKPFQASYKQWLAPYIFPGVISD